jgi:CrcB protein
VAFGAGPGACLRFRLVNRLEPRLAHRHWATACVNIVACLLLGVVLGLAGDVASGPGPWRWALSLVGTGFLGSLSTFSTVIAEVSALLGRRRPAGALLLLLVSLLMGLLSVRLGYGLAAALRQP